MSGIQADMMRVYYRRLFPFEPYINWLQYGSPRYLENREFSFTLEDDIYIRYQSFSNKEEFEREVKNRCPVKIDIGAVFSLRPRDHRNNTRFQPVEKELVFDIDMTDYDEVRTCCEGANICPKCWKFLAIACRIMDVALEEDFGWKHRLWVFSGRRGVHCWVCDESARKLDGPQRAAVSEYLQLITGGDNQAKKVTFTEDRLHPSITRALDVIREYFNKMMLEEQDILGNSVQCVKFMKLIPDEELKLRLDNDFNQYKSSVDRWKAFERNVNKLISERNNRGTYKLRHLVAEVMIQLTYPRLDIQVSKGLNHLLKSPFCVHPKTGKVCVPFNVKSVDKFDPTKVPTVERLIREIDDYDAERAEKDIKTDGIKDFKKTSLNEAIKMFTGQFLPLVIAQVNSERSLGEPMELF